MYRIAANINRFHQLLVSNKDVNGDRRGQRRQRLQLAHHFVAFDRHKLHASFIHAEALPREQLREMGFAIGHQLEILQALSAEKQAQIDDAV